MKTFSISAAVALLAALAQAAPAPEPLEARAPVPVTLVLQAAAFTTTLIEPPTATKFPINLDGLNINLVYDKSPVTVTLTGKNGATYIASPSKTIAIGPPQPLVSGSFHF